MTIAAGTKPHPIFLAGRWVESPDVLTVSNPADPATPAGSTYNATDGAVRGGRRGRRARPSRSRARCRPTSAARSCATISAGIKARREELGRLIALEAGKPIRDALVEVDRAVLTFRLGAEEAERMTGEVIPLDLHAVVAGPDRHHAALPDRARSPAISPFNFPLNLAAHKVVAGDRGGQLDRAQAAVQGPADDADRGRDHRGGRARRRARSAILPMTRELGDRMVADDRFKLLTFTGRPSVGWRMKERAGKKQVVLELGGNAGVIVDKTADLDWAVKRCLVGAFTLRRPGLHQRPADVHPRGRSGTRSWTGSWTAPGRSRSAIRSTRDRRRPDGRRARPPAGPQRWVDEARRARRQGCSSAARPTARSSRRRS